MERNRRLASTVKNKVGKCVNCGSAEELETHHIVALVNGGMDIESNITVLCHNCHCNAHNKVNKGYSKPQGRKPKVSYDDAKEYIRDYIDCKITIRELKKHLNVGENSQSSIMDIRSVARYVKENGVTKEQLDKARKHSAYILTGYEHYLV